jgi:hypothetical protein
MFFVFTSVEMESLVAFVLVKVKVKQSRYTPWRRLGGEEV